MALDLIFDKSTTASSGTDSSSGGDAASSTDSSTSSNAKPAYQLQNVLASLLSPEDAAGLPQLNLSLNDALLFRRSEGADGSHSLFVADIGTGLDLGPFLERFGFATGPNASLQLRLLAASGSSTHDALQGFTPDQVKDMNGLLPAGIDPLPTDTPYQEKFAIRKGFDATVQFGNLSFGADSTDTGASRSTAATPQGATTPAAAGNTASSIKWFSIQKSFGPVHIARVGAVFVKDQNSKTESNLSSMPVLPQPG